MRWQAQVYLNVREDGLNFLHGYQDRDPLATDQDLVLAVEAPSLLRAAERMFAVGNRQMADAEGRMWPSDVRSISVGDVLVFPDGPMLRCLSFGWAPVERSLLKVPLAGTRATSRGAE